MTSMLKLHAAVLPDPSVATQSSLVLPRLTRPQEDGAHATVVGPQLSTATGAAKHTLAPPATHSATWLPGHITVGGVVSTTVTNVVQRATLSQVSPHSMTTVLRPSE